VDVRILEGTGDRRAEIRAQVFDDAQAPADGETLARLQRAVADVDLAAPPVVLPDFHHKSDMEMPSSIVVATRESIRPHLTSASVNCGMALIALDMEPPSRSATVAFFDAVRTRSPHPPGWRRELSGPDVLRTTAEGAEFAVERYGLDPGALERIEEGGRLDVDQLGGVDRIRRELPRLSLQLSRLRFGSIGPSNHFVELQVVDEILDSAVADRLGIAAGQAMIQYHSGGGVLTGQIGRLFASRKKRSLPMRAQMALQKPVLHLASARSISQVRERLAVYFGDGDRPIPADGREGRRFMLANAAAMNYGFAFRAATYALLNAQAERVFGVRGTRLVVDSPHNSIYEEQIDGTRAFVHRHNSCRAYPAARMPAGTTFGEIGQAVLVPGSSRTSSYLCVAGEDAERSLHSACHGAGTIIEDFERRGVSSERPDGRVTLRFRYGSQDPQPTPHLDDLGVDAAMGILSGNRLARPVARLRPLAVLT
jgi:tRNA-splicing ligase RtcB